MKNEVIIRLFNSRRGVIAKPFICQAGAAGTVSGHFLPSCHASYLRCMVDCPVSSRCIWKHYFNLFELKIWYLTELVELHNTGNATGRVSGRGCYNNRHVWYASLYTLQIVLCWKKHFPRTCVPVIPILLFDITRLLSFNKSTKIMD